MLKVTRQGIAYHRIKSEKFKCEKEIIHAFKINKGLYGKRYIKAWLGKRRIQVSLPTIAKVLRYHNLESILGQKCRKKYNKSAAEYTAEYLAKDKSEYTNFLDLVSADITVIKCYREKLYLSGIIDIATRLPVGITMSKNMKQELVQNSIQDMYDRFGIPKMYHCDRGSQYTAMKTKQQLEEHGVQISMSRPGSPNDNQYIESFWHTLKAELGDVTKKTYDEVEMMIFEYIVYYSAKRLHSSLGYMTPLAAKFALSPRGE